MPSNNLRNNELGIYTNIWDSTHGNEGIMEDYADLLRLDNQTKVLAAIHLLGIKKRIANKKICPCGCKRRLGACHFHNRLNKFRNMASPSWFRKHCI